MRLRRLGCIVVLVAMLAGCGGAPLAQVTPNVTPVNAPTTAAAASPPGPPTPTVVATPQPATAPPATPVATRVAPTVATAEPPTEALPPPTPDAPLSQALRRYEGNALLYTRPDRFLMLRDADGRQLWLTADERFCGRENSAYSQGGAWSTDGRYVAISCQDDGFDSKLLVELATVNILDVETSKMRRVEAGSSEARGIRVDAGAALWAPHAPRLLIYTERVIVTGTDSQYFYGWSVVDAATGAVKELISFDAEGGSYPDAAWSPDGSQMAVIGRRLGEQHSGVYLVNIDGSAARRLKLDDVASFYGFSGSLAWSPDGRSLLLNRQLNPSPDVYTFQALLVDVKSGRANVLADNPDTTPRAHWSPDGKWFLLSKYATGDRTIVAWSLYQADGTLIRSFSSDPARSVEDIVWLPDGKRLAFAVNRVNFGVEVVLADLGGVEQVVATRPWAFAHRIAVAPDSSLLALELDEPGRAQTDIVDRHGIILDLQGRTRSEFDGRIWGWRPQR